MKKSIFDKFEPDFFCIRRERNYFGQKFDSFITFAKKVKETKPIDDPWTTSLADFCRVCKYFQCKKLKNGFFEFFPHKKKQILISSFKSYS